MKIDRRGNLPPIENQRETPKCVGYAFRALAYEAGYDLEAQVIYEKAQYLDALPGEDYGGTQLVGGFRMLNNIGLGGRVVTVPLARQVIVDQLHTSCIVISARADLFGGSADAYHAVCLCGYDKEMDAILVRNSWGTTYGNGGYNWLTLDSIMRKAQPVGYGIIPKEKTRKAFRKKNYAIIGGIVAGIVVLVGGILWFLN